MKILKVIKNNWKDPVWSRVIAWAIIGTLTLLLTSIWLLFKYLVKDVSFSTLLTQVRDNIIASDSIPRWLLYILIIITSTSIISLILNLLNRFKNDETINKPSIKNEQTENHEHSDVLFYYRLTEAFPGQRGLVWTEKREAVKRLSIIFKEPFYFKVSKNVSNHSPEHDPFWWFRGTSSLPIRSFKVLKKNLVLINDYEFKVKSMAAHISDSRYLNFIYLNIEGDKPSGVYPFDKKKIADHVNSIGYSSERVGLFKGKYIKGEEFDDGAMFRNGKHIDLSQSELRIRYLSDFNLIIVPKASAFNSQEFDRLSEPYFEDIIKKKILPEKLIEFMKEYSRNQ